MKYITILLLFLSSYAFGQCDNTNATMGFTQDSTVNGITYLTVFSSWDFWDEAFLVSMQVDGVSNCGQTVEVEDGGISFPCSVPTNLEMCVTLTGINEDEEECHVLRECFSPPLPVYLITFKAVLSGEEILLNWSTASEENNDRFEIERSPDARNWQTIGMVKGSGTQSTRVDYSFKDLAPEYGANYYRLKQIDYDGAFEYSPIEVVEKQIELLKVYPNPIENNTLQYKLDGETFTEDVSFLGPGTHHLVREDSKGNLYRLIFSKPK